MECSRPDPDVGTIARSDRTLNCRPTPSLTPARHGRADPRSHGLGSNQQGSFARPRDWSPPRRRLGANLSGRWRPWLRGVDSDERRRLPPSHRTNLDPSTELASQVVNQAGHPRTIIERRLLIIPVQLSNSVGNSCHCTHLEPWVRVCGAEGLTRFLSDQRSC